GDLAAVRDPDAVPARGAGGGTGQPAGGTLPDSAGGSGGAGEVRRRLVRGTGVAEDPRAGAVAAGRARRGGGTTDAPCGTGLPGQGGCGTGPAVGGRAGVRARPGRRAVSRAQTKSPAGEAGDSSREIRRSRGGRRARP